MGAKVALEGKPIIITGASSGIGAATAIACANVGMPVALFARREDKLNELKSRIEQAGGSALVVVGDVTDPQANLDLLARAQDAFGPIYAALANAGYGLEHESATMPISDIRAMFETNFFGSMHLIQPAIKHFREQGTGHAMMVSSCLSKIGIPYYACYCATKAAQDKFCRSMRLELAPEGIHVSSIHPVGTKTEFFETANANTTNGLRVASTKQNGFMQTPERVADAIVRCLRKPKGEVWTSFPTRFALAGTVAFPSLTDAIFKRALRKRLERKKLKNQ
ncbi:MAG: SDR family NAD(P)-dependent oxidoreductase [Phycisphaerales bacterium]|nr:SDR family NAD(P)-dependent oxidoreductase [Phycisphaerales bacterium]